MVNLAFSEAVTGLDLFDFSISGANLGALSGSGSSYSLTLTSISSNISLGLLEGAATDPASNLSEPQNYTLAYDGTPPKVAQFVEISGDGSYKDGETLSIAVLMDSLVHVSSGVTLTLSNGQTASCGTGTGVSSFSCSYTIASAHTNSTALDVTAINNVSLITDSASNPASSTLPSSPHDLANESIMIDTLAPTSVSITAPSDAAITGDITPQVTWSASDANPMTYHLAIATTSGCAAPLQDYPNEAGSSKTLTSLSDGTYFACLKASDLAGNTTAAAEISFTVDTSGPVITSFRENGGDSSYKDGDTLTIDVNMDSTVDVASGVTLTLSNGQTATCGTGSGVTSFSCTYTIATAHTNSSALDVTAINNVSNITDTASNPALSSLPSFPNDLANENIIIDTSAPTSVSIEAPSNAATIGDDTPLVTWSASDTNTMTYDLAIGTTSGCATTVQDYPGETGTSKTLTSLTDGTYYVCLSAVDIAGNSTAATETTLTVDTAPPTISSFTENSGDSSYKEGDTLTIDVHMDSAVDVASGVTLTLSNGQTATCGTGSGVTSISCTYTIATAHTNSSALDVTAINNVSNITDTASNPTSSTLPSSPNDLANQGIIIDNAAPTSVSIEAPSNAATIGDDTPTVTWSASDANTMTYDLAIDTTSGCATPVQDYPGETGTSKTLTSLADGTYYVCLSAVDIAGNSTTATETTFTVDAAPPTISSFTENSGDSSYKNGDTLTIDVHMDSSVDVASGVTLTLSNGQTATCGTGSGVTSFSCTYTIATAHTNSSALDVTAINNASNITDAGLNPASSTLPSSPNDLANQGIIIDTAAPTSVSIEAPSDTATTGDDTPLVTWSASDANTMTYDLAIGTTSGCATPVQDYPGETGTSKTLTTLSEGTYYVCLTATDVAGNSKAATETTFTVDTTAPTISSFTENSGDSSYKDGDTLTIDVHMDSSVDVASGVTLTLSNGQTATCGTESGVTSFSCTYTIATAHPNSSALDVTAINNASNITDIASNPTSSTLPSSPNDLANESIIIDTAAPTSVSITFPSDTATTGDDTPLVTWSASDANTMTYHLAIDTTSGCATLVQDYPGEAGISKNLPPSPRGPTMLASQQRM